MRRRTVEIFDSDDEDSRGFINLCCSLGRAESATSIEQSTEPGLHEIEPLVVHQILRLFPELAS